MSIWKKIFSKKAGKSHQTYNFDLSNIEGKAIEDFSKLNEDNRVIQIMILGDTGNLKYFDLLRFSIESDPSINVKFAALKRIHFFKEHPDLKPLLTGMQGNRFIENLEPYFSMTLSRTGVISIEDFKNRINSYKEK
jgi:hypothetical protein